MASNQKKIDFESQYYIAIITDSKGTHYSRVFTENGELIFEQDENSYEREDALAVAEHWLYMEYEAFLEAEPDDDLPRSVSEIARENGVRYER